MLSENNPLLKLRLKRKKIYIVEFYKKIIQSFYILYDLMLEKSSENILFECFSIFMGYFQLIIHSFDPIVSHIINISKNNFSFGLFGAIKI
jgi:hypothetical protein